MQDEILEEMRKVTDGVANVIIYTNDSPRAIPRRGRNVLIDGTYRDGQTDTLPLPRRLLLEEGNVNRLVKVNGV